MYLRWVGVALVTVATAFAAPNAVIATISSTAPININGTDTPATAAPSWPLAEKDEIANNAPALLQTPGRNTLRLDARSRARITAAPGRQPYIYLRAGGLQFHGQSGPIYVCAGDRLYVSPKGGDGRVAVGEKGSVTAAITRGAFIEQGSRTCGPDFAVAFLTGLPAAAGASVGGATGGFSTTAVVGAVAAGGAAGVSSYVAASAAASSPCASQNGCNFNPLPLSPSQP